MKEEITVQMERLDDLFTDCIANIDKPSVFLKCDTQGHDLEVLRGAPKSLFQVRALQIEVPVVHVYNNMRSFGENMDALKDMNFLPCAFYPVTTIGKDGISVLEFDCIAYDLPSMGFDDELQEMRRPSAA